MSKIKTRIAVPPGSDVRLAFVRPIAWVAITPPGAPSAFALLQKQGQVIGLFVHDDGVGWPDPIGCAAASEYLAQGIPVALEFNSFRDATGCHQRLMREIQGRPS